MKKVNSLIMYVLEVLFLTNLWIIIYTNLLPVLNFLYPAISTVNFYRPAVAFPEKFEMPLYLLLTFLFVITIYFTLRVREPISTHPEGELRKTSYRIWKKTIKYLTLIFLTLLFFSKLGVYPLSNEIYPYSLRPDKSIYTLVIFIYLSVLTIIILESVILFRLIKRSSLLTTFYYLLTTLIIAILIFEPKFPISFLEYAFFFGPIWDITQGKTIFTDLPSQYGFLSILFFSLFFKLKLFVFSHLSIWNWIFHIVQYFICFYLIYKISKSLALGLIGLFSIITLNYYSFYIPALTIAQYGALRRLPFFLALFLFYKLKKIDSPLFIFLYALMSFWIVDSGIQMIFAYGLTLFYLLLGKQIDLKRFFRALSLLFLSMLGIFISINLIHVLLGYKSINPVEIITTLRQYAISGVGMIPMEKNTYFWLVMLIYFATIIYVFRNTIQTVDDGGWKIDAEVRRSRVEKFNHLSSIFKFQPSTFYHLSSNNLTLLLFSANLMFFASLYFVGRSDNASLIIISIFPLLTLFLLLGQLIKNEFDFTSQKIRFMFYVSCLILFVAFPAYQRKVTLTELLIQKYSGISKGAIFTNELDSILNNRFSKEKILITKYLTGNNLLILSSDDTYLFYLTGKTNLLDENPQSGIESDVEMNFAIKNAVKTCLKRIAVDCSIVKKCPPFTPLTKGWLTAGYILSELEKGCRKKYQPVECTSQLCITEVVD